MAWLWWILGLLLLALLVWWLWPDGDGDVEPLVTDEVGVVEVEPVAPVVAEVEPGNIPIADILANPAQWAGREVSGEVSVAEVPTDRGFWIEDGGARMFAILVDQPPEQPNVNAGQMVSISQAVLRDRTFLPEMQGAPLDADTRRIAESQALFLVVDEANLTIDSRPTP